MGKIIDIPLRVVVVEFGLCCPAGVVDVEPGIEAFLISIRI